MYQQIAPKLNEATSNGVNKTILITIFIFILGLTLPTLSLAQGMPAPYFAEGNSAGMGFSSSSPDNATIQSQQEEEQEGKKLLDDLNNKTIACSQLKDTDFEKIGEYFMGQSIGDTSRHVSMNEMMKRMMGEKGEEQMHTVMCKRLSGCDTSVAFPSQDIGFMPMMNMMNYGNYNYRTGGNGMMGNWGNNMMGGNFYGASWFGAIFQVLFLALVVLTIVALIKWLLNQNKK